MIHIQEKPELSYLNQLLNRVRGSLPIPASFPLERNIAEQLQNIRDNAASWVKELAIPTRRHEDWRFTDLSALLELPFQPTTAVELSRDEISPLILPEVKGTRLVFVNGFYSPQLSCLDNLPDGVFVGNLGQLDKPLSDKLGNYLTQQPDSQEVFTALNTSSLADAAVVWVHQNQVIDTPIHLLFISLSSSQPVTSQPRTLIVAEPGSKATVIEHYATANILGCSDRTQKTPYFTNTVTELWVGDNAELQHTRLQRELASSFHIGRTVVSQGRSSRYTGNAISLGAKLSRHNFDIHQTAVGTETQLNGLTLVNGQQVADTHSAVFLNHPHGVINQLHKAIVDDRAHAIFNGRIVVPQAAQMTDATQLNRNLLLSAKGRVNTKPQLEIVADNVKCAHGATVSQLEADEIFYLRSRGLDEKTSRNLLIDAFAAEILEKLPLVSLKQILSRCVACRTDEGEM
ncbi:Fe-S cluster assembly protein SufD [Arthrospira platensis BEA 1257B]